MRGRFLGSNKDGADILGADGRTYFAYWDNLPKDSRPGDEVSFQESDSGQATLLSLVQVRHRTGSRAWPWLALAGILALLIGIGFNNAHG
ncbi:MAG: hypothetical protein ACXW3D_05735 [Caulobacteraceae bacterium]